MSLLDLIIFFPILAAIAIGLGMNARRTAVVAAICNLIGVITACLMFKGAALANGFAYTATRPIFPAMDWNYSVGADGLTLVMLLLSALVTVAAVWETRNGTKLHYISSLLISAGAIGAFCATDLIFFHAFHELALIPTFLMIGMHGHGEKEHAAWKITLYLGLGSLFLLAGLGYYVFQLTGDQLTFDMVRLRELARADTLSMPVLNQVVLLLVLGFGVLVSLWPLHSWAAPAYAAAPTPVAMMHAGVLKKFGIYGLLRLVSPLLPQSPETLWAVQLLLWLLLGNIIIVGMMTIAQRRLDTMLGNSSVMHMGYAFLGLACGNILGAQGATLLMFAHGLSIALLFALCGRIREQVGDTNFQAVGGLGKIAPNTTLLFGLAAFASIGLPGFANFAAELSIFFGAFASMTLNKIGPVQIAGMVAIWGVVISAIYMLRAYRHLFFGEKETSPGFQDIGWLRKWPLTLLLLASMAVGFYPNLLLDFTRQSLSLLVGAR